MIEKLSYHLTIPTRIFGKIVETNFTFPLIVIIYTLENHVGFGSGIILALSTILAFLIQFGVVTISNKLVQNYLVGYYISILGILPRYSSRAFKSANKIILCTSIMLAFISSVIVLLISLGEIPTREISLLRDSTVQVLFFLGFLTLLPIPPFPLAHLLDQESSEKEATIKRSLEVDTLIAGKKTHESILKALCNNDIKTSKASKIGFVFANIFIISSFFNGRLSSLIVGLTLFYFAQNWNNRRILMSIAEGISVGDLCHSSPLVVNQNLPLKDAWIKAAHHANSFFVLINHKEEPTGILNSQELHILDIDVESVGDKWCKDHPPYYGVVSKDFPLKQLFEQNINSEAPILVTTKEGKIFGTLCLKSLSKPLFCFYYKRYIEDISE